MTAARGDIWKGNNKIANLSQLRDTDACPLTRAATRRNRVAFPCENTENKDVFREARANAGSPLNMSEEICV